MAEITWVLMSPLKATVPVTSVVGRNVLGATGASSSLARCAGVSVPGGASPCSG